MAHPMPSILSGPAPRPGTIRRGDSDAFWPNASLPRTGTRRGRASCWPRPLATPIHVWRVLGKHGITFNGAAVVSNSAVRPKGGGHSGSVAWTRPRTQLISVDAFHPGLGAPARGSGATHGTTGLRLSSLPLIGVSVAHYRRKRRRDLDFKNRDTELHVVLDNFVTHKACRWLARHPLGPVHTNVGHRR